MNTPNTRFGWQGAGARGADAAVFDEGLRQHMLRVYNYMGLGLVLTGIVAMVVGTTPALYVPIFSSPLKYVVMLAPLAFVLFFSFRIEAMSASTAQLTFWAFCAVMGLSLASIFLGLYRAEHRPHLLRGRDHVRRDQPLRLYDEGRPVALRLVPDHGPDRRGDRQHREHLPGLDCPAVRDFGDRHRGVRRPDRL